MSHYQESDLSQAIRARATRHKAPEDMRTKISAALSDADSILTKPPRKWGWLSPQLQWINTGLAFVFGVIVSLTVTQFHPMPNDDERLTQEIISSHVRSLMGAHISDVASSDKHTVKPWFNGKLDYSPPVLDLAPEGFPLVGGRLDYLNQRTVAALVYRRQQHLINLFVWPSGGKGSSEMSLRSRQGFNLIEWNDSAMSYRAVSDLNAGEMQQFSQILRKN